MLIEGQDLPNVSFQGDRSSLDGMPEQAYVEGIVSRLRRILGQAFERFDFVVFSGREPVVPDLSAADPKRTVLIYVSEEFSRVPHDACARALAVFKAYLPAEGLAPNLFSLPLGYAITTPYLPPKPANERRYSVFFSGALRRNRRPMYQSLLYPAGLPFSLPYRALFALRGRGPHRRVLGGSYLAFTRNFGQGLPGDEYARFLVDSKIVLCPRGAKTPETFRHFEAMRAGAVVVSEPLPALEFYVGSPMVVVESWHALRPLLLGLLSDPDELAERQQRTLAWWAERCSEDAMAGKIATEITRLAAEAG